MKKIISIIMFGMLSFLLFACGNKASNNTNMESSNTQSIETVNENAMHNTIVSSIIKSKCVSDYRSDISIDNMDTIEFGNYYINNNSIKEPIEWLTLEKNNDTALLITKYAIDAKPYNNENVPTTWETSSLRQWLNNEFISIAFDNDEQNLLIESVVSADKNPDSDVNVGNATNDKVFLLSINECIKYFNSEKKRECKATNYAISNECTYTDEDDNDGMYVGNCFWSLRTPGDDQYLVSGVYSEGEIATWGTDLIGEYGKSGVRPVIKVKVNIQQASNFVSNNTKMLSEDEDLKLTQNIYWYLSIDAKDSSVVHMSSNYPTNVSHVTIATNAVQACCELNISEEDIKTIVIDDEIIPETCNSMFADLGNLSKIVNIENLNTSLCTDMTQMFRGYMAPGGSFGSLESLDLSHFDTKNVEKMDYMFQYQSKLEYIDISSFDFSKIYVHPVVDSGPAKDRSGCASVYQMFDSCSNLKTIYSNKDIKVDGTLNMGNMFNGCIKLVGGNGTPFNSNKCDISMAVIDSEYQSGYFTYDSSKYYWKDGCYFINGVKQANKWIIDKFDKYYVDKNGKKVLKTWKDGKYLGDDGRMLRNTKTPDGKFVNYDGNAVDTDKDYENINSNDIKANAWFRTENGIWYYFEGDRTTLKKGWFDDPQDGQRYYLDLDTGIMLTGWQEIDGNKYYFNERPSVIPNWYYVPENDTWASYGKKIKALGSMFRNEETPDGKKVDGDGKLIK